MDGLLEDLSIEDVKGEIDRLYRKYVTPEDDNTGDGSNGSTGDGSGKNDDDSVSDGVDGVGVDTEDDMAVVVNVASSSNDPTRQNSRKRLLDNAHRLFDAPDMLTTDPSYFQETQEMLENEIKGAYYLAVRMRVLEMACPITERTYLEKIIDAWGMLIKYSNIINIETQMAQITYGQYDPQDFDSDIFRFNHITTEDLGSLQKCIVYLLTKSLQKRYKRFNDYIYKPRYNKKGHFTYSYIRHQSIEEFVFGEVAQKESNFDLWTNMHDHDNIRKCIKYLANSQEYELGVIKKDRSVFSYRNGVYFAERNYFHRYEKGEIRPSVNACRYLDLDFDDDWVGHDDAIFPANRLTPSDTTNKYRDWYDIETPRFQKIFEFQDLPDEVIRWVYILIGRMLFDVGTHDDWQVVPYFKGVANSGKSTIGEIVQQLYEEEDVGVITNNNNVRFGLGAVYDKLIWVAAEVNEDMANGLDQAVFQQIISGEVVNVELKNIQTRGGIKWKPPGLMAGNVLIGFTDNAGSIGRRFVLFEFNNPVLKTDGTLKTAITTHEIPRLIVKCARAYQEKVREMGKKNFWDKGMVPEYFHGTRKSIEGLTNSLYSFLSSQSLTFEFEIDMKRKYAELTAIPAKEYQYCIPESQFKNEWKKYHQNYFPTTDMPKWDINAFTSMFARFGICRSKNRIRRRWSPNPSQQPPTIRNVHYILGCDLVSQDDGAEDPSQDQDYDAVAAANSKTRFRRRGEGGGSGDGDSNGGDSGGSGDSNGGDSNGGGSSGDGDGGGSGSSGGDDDDLQPPNKRHHGNNDNTQNGNNQDTQADRADDDDNGFGFDLSGLAHSPPVPAHHRPNIKKIGLTGDGPDGASSDSAPDSAPDAAPKKKMSTMERKRLRQQKRLRQRQEEDRKSGGLGSDTGDVGAATPAKSATPAKPTTSAKPATSTNSATPPQSPAKPPQSPAKKSKFPKPQVVFKAKYNRPHDQ